MADYSPVYTGGNKPFTKTASATITGGQVVAISGVSTVGPAAAGSTVVVGVAAHDAVSGVRVTIWPIVNCEHEVTVVAAGTITAGDGVITGASGTVATATIATAAAAGTLIGVATTTATAGNKVRFVGRA